MIVITKAIEWDMGHRIPNHDNKCNNPHGHRYRLEVTLNGPICQDKDASTEGMLYDFSHIKEIMVSEVQEPLDHSFMASEEDQTMVKFYKESPHFKHQVVPFVPTAENIVHWCYSQIKAKLPTGLTVAKCRLYESPNSWADYRAS